MKDKKNEKIEDKTEMEITEVIEEAEEATEETVLEGKTRLSLKKKIGIGAAVAVGLVLGAFALGHKSGSNDADEEDVPESDSEEILDIEACEEIPAETTAE